MSQFSCPIVTSSDLGVVYTDDELVRLYRGVVTLARHHLCYKYFYHEFPQRIEENFVLFPSESTTCHLQNSPRHPRPMVPEPRPTADINETFCFGKLQSKKVLMKYILDLHCIQRQLCLGKINKTKCLLDAVETPLSLLHSHTLCLLGFHHVVKLEQSRI